VKGEILRYELNEKPIRRLRGNDEIVTNDLDLLPPIKNHPANPGRVLV